MKINKIRPNAPINVKPAGEGEETGHGVGHLTNLILPRERIFESFFPRHGTNVGMDLTADSDERD